MSFDRPPKISCWPNLSLELTTLDSNFSPDRHVSSELPYAIPDQTTRAIEAADRVQAACQH